MGHRLVYNDSTHAYYLNGKRGKAVTSVAKICADSYALDQWRKRQVAIGMMLDRSLAERVAVDPDNREAVDAICDDALRIAGAHSAAERGTQRHRASELVDTGGELLTEQQREDAAAWRRTLDLHGLEVDREYVEGFAIHPDYLVCGRYDRIMRYRGRHVLVDLKSGENAVMYPQTTAAQMALYAHAPLISASVSTAGDKSEVTEWRRPPEDLDRETGYVVLLGDGDHMGQLWAVDLTGGNTAACLALELVAWRKSFNYGVDLARPVLTFTEDQAVAAVSNALDATPVPLLEQVENAPTLRALEALWADNRDAWTWEHTAAAVRRKEWLHGRSLRNLAGTAASK